MVHPKQGDFVHWTAIWDVPVNLWAEITDARNINNLHGRVVAGSAKINSHTWAPGSALNCSLDPGMSYRSGCAHVFVPRDELPDEVLAEITKRILIEGES